MNKQPYTNLDRVLGKHGSDWDELKAAWDELAALRAVAETCAHFLSQLSAMGQWGPELCMTRSRRSDGLLCAGAGVTLCAYCAPEYAARKSLRQLDAVLAGQGEKP